MSINSRLVDYDNFLIDSNRQSNVIINPINQLNNYKKRNTQSTNYSSNNQSTNYLSNNQLTNYSSNSQSTNYSSNNQLPNYYQSSSTVYCQPNIQSSQNVQPNQQDWLQPVSASSSSTASTALLQVGSNISTTQPSSFQTTITTTNGLNTQTQLIPKSKIVSNKLNSISIWPINRNKTNFNQPTTPLLNVNNLNCSTSSPQLISKLNRSSFTYHLLTCALIIGIITLILIVISSIYIYSSYANRVSKSAKLNEIELCSSIECHLGAICKIDTSYKQPYCDCEQFNCDNNLIKLNKTQFICGSDNVTYKNICELKKTACWTQKRIDILQYSECVNKNSNTKLIHPNNKLTNELNSNKGKDNLFLINPLDPTSSIDVNFLLNNPLAKQDACNQIGCSYGSTCQIRQIRNVSLSYTNIATKPDSHHKKSVRLVCECPSKCSSYEHIISELISEVNLRFMNSNNNLQQDDHYSSSDYKQKDEYYQSNNHQSATNTATYFNEQFINGLTIQSGAVCGSNARDYKNLCELAKSSCASQTRISIKYFGLCDPCASHHCAEDEICKLKSNRQPYCDCGNRGKGNCSKLQKYQNPDHVCGSDGNTYLNECVLFRHTCVNERNVSIISNNECVKGSHPCHKIHCNVPMECHVSSTTNQASCECNQHCASIYKPVCSTDNRTYDSACHLSLETCLRGNSQPSLGLLHQGICGTSALSKSITNLNNKNLPLIVINEEEHGDILNPLTNLQSNDNQQCAPNTCPNHGICLLAFLNGIEKVTCECPQCTLTRSLSSSYKNSLNASLNSNEQKQPKSTNLDNVDGPVCGSDSVTYASECELRKFSCEQQKHITIKHKGACRGCEQLKCKNYALCETNSVSGASECVCPEACEKLDAPVCSSDGTTFANECELRVHSCKAQKEIFVRSVGPCNICEKIKCKFNSICKNGRCTCSTYCKQSDSEDLLCASNGRTFANDCDLKRYACLHQVELNVVHIGECESGSTTKKYNSSFFNDKHNDESVETGVRLINDEENEDEFREILRQQSAEDESNGKNLNKQSTNDRLSKNSSNHKHHHLKHHHNRNKLNSKHQSLHSKQRNQLCRKLKCEKYGATCKLDQKDLNQTKYEKNNNQQSESNNNIELNRISLELIAYCDCSHINCDQSDKNESICGSDGKLYSTLCEMKEKSCKLQKNITIKQRKYCDSLNSKDDLKSQNTNLKNNLNSKLNKSNESTINSDCSAGFWGLKSKNDDNSNKLSTTKQTLNQDNELDLFFDNYVSTNDNLEINNYQVNSNLPNCIPCDCNTLGSLNQQCNQNTGQCVCKFNVKGDKCDYCDEDKELTELGCISTKVARPSFGHCGEINCSYGANCELVGQTAQCKCNSISVCGDEYRTANISKLDSIRKCELNDCELKMYMCLVQEKIIVDKC